MRYSCVFNATEFAEAIRSAIPFAEPGTDAVLSQVHVVLLPDYKVYIEALCSYQMFRRELEVLGDGLNDKISFNISLRDARRIAAALPKKFHDEAEISLVWDMGNATIEGGGVSIEIGTTTVEYPNTQVFIQKFSDDASSPLSFPLWIHPEKLAIMSKPFPKGTAVRFDISEDGVLLRLHSEPLGITVIGTFSNPPA